ncbi:MAG TPA: aldo/keto reductase [Clostridiales bacterium]|nr:aldo/keto reductase [Clostridiales bacterium]
MQSDIKKISDRATLNNGVQIPWLGLGVFMADDPAELSAAISSAVQSGYRSIDTADIYGNEETVGRAIRNCGVPRSELFITTKLWNEWQAEGYEASLKAFDRSLKRLGLSYLDLYLIHWPIEGKSVTAWRALVKLYQEGLVRAIGVSNFSGQQIDELIQAAGITPAVNQIELHPLRSQKPLLAYCQQHNIQVEAYCPLMRGRFQEVAVLAGLAQKYGKTPAQIVLRWEIQCGAVVIPKSVHADRIRENADIFDFELNPADMAVIDSCNRDQTVLPPPPEDLRSKD